MPLFFNMLSDKPKNKSQMGRKMSVYLLNSFYENVPEPSTFSRYSPHSHAMRISLNCMAAGAAVQ